IRRMGGRGRIIQPGDIRYDCSYMTQQPPTKIHLEHSSDYRENYANSVQIRVNLWDFFLLFGLVNQTSPEYVSIHNFQGIYLSPQQAKALWNVLGQNVVHYENTFGEIKLDPKVTTGQISIQ
ncbi:MAG: DUF3467 domain-containing protein, partial [Terriglobia bacterium]